MAESRVCVYCASSEHCHSDYMQAAFRLGETLARNRTEIVYGEAPSVSWGSLQMAHLPMAEESMASCRVSWRSWNGVIASLPI